MIRSILLCAALALPAALAASDLDEIKAKLTSGDAGDKREACKALASKSVGDDDTALQLLVAAVGDRQAHDAAIDALRARTGLAPAAYRGQSHYPNYPSGDTAADWSTWLAERKREKDQEKKLKEAEQLAAEAKKTADKAKKEAGKGDKGEKGEGDQATGEAGGDAAKGDAAKTGGDAAKTGDKGEAKPERALPPPEELGKLDRVVFKNGSSLMCYILTRRTDADGNLISLRVIHPDGSGEETIEAGMISRIEEDVK